MLVDGDQPGGGIMLDATAGDLILAATSAPAGAPAAASRAAASGDVVADGDFAARGNGCIALSAGSTLDISRGVFDVPVIDELPVAAVETRAIAASCRSEACPSLQLGRMRRSSGIDRACAAVSFRSSGEIRAMKIYDSQTAPNPRRVRIFLAEKGVAGARTSRSTSSRPTNRSPEFRAKNPLGTLPVLELDDGTCIAESVAICRYFEELHPDPPLMGTDARDRALVEMWQRRMELELLHSGHPGVPQRATRSSPAAFRRSPE